MNLRDTIQKEAERQDISGYRLGQLSGVPIRTVQRYLSGTTDITGENLEAMIQALGLELRPRKKMKRG